MKLIFIFMLAALLQVNAASFGQRITLNVKESTLKEVFKSLRKQSQYGFYYDENMLKEAKPVTFTAINEPIGVVLEKCFKDQTLTYVIQQNTIVVKRRITQPKETNSINNRKDISINGKVTDGSGAPLPGVSVSIKGTTKGVITKPDGTFTLSVADNKQVLVFSFIGFETKEVPADAPSFDITLIEKPSALNEVVVVGYGTQKKVSLTNAVSKVTGEIIASRPVSNIQQGLQGQTSGLTILDNGGAPGRTSTTIRVRGVTSLPDPNIPTKNGALIIVDGIEQDLNDLNPNDVESVSVLKDAASTAIYGSRAANGVILVTTKRGKSGKVTVNYNGYYAIQKSVNAPEMMSTDAYMRLEQLAYQNAGIAVPALYSNESISNYSNSTDREKYPLPNVWYKELFSAAPQINNNVSVAGGGENFTARFSTRYTKQNSIIKNYGADIKETRINTDYKVSPKISFGADLGYRQNSSTAPSQEGAVYDRIFHGSLFAVPKYSDGSYGLSAQGNNPLLFAEMGGVSAQVNETTVANLKGDWQIIKGLKFSTQYALRIERFKGKDYANAYSVTDKNTNLTKTVPNSTLTETRNGVEQYTFNNLLTYQNQFKDHNFSGLLGYSEISTQLDNLSAYRERFYSNDITSIGQGANDGTKTNTGNDAQWGLRSYFGRVNYSYKDKYLFEANGRYDGSSRFTGNNIYSFFPSFSGGWRLSQESFLSEVYAINELKIRASWGRSGNQAVDLYSFYQALTPTSYSFNGTSVTGYTPTALANTDITWETTTQSNIGFDATLFNNLTVTFDYYRKRTNGILINLPIPATIGLTAPPQNAGVVENNGFEINLGYKGSINKFRYGFDGNFSLNNNKVVSLAGTGPYISGTDIDPRYIIKEGLPINTHWGYKTDGLFQTAEEIASYPTYAANTKPGDVKYVDLNNDGVINSNDMTAIGSSFPKYTFGFNTRFGYGDFELNAFFQGAAGVDTRLSGALAEMGNNEGFTSKVVEGNYWTPDNTSARFPRPVKRDLRNVNTSDRLMIDGSYLRLKNLQLNYNLPAAFIKKASMSRASIYLSATNLLTFSKLNEWGLDPEAGSGRATYYPQTALYTVGLNIQF